MKKLFLTAILATTFLWGANAQTVISNDYGSPITGADNQNINDIDDDETMGVFNLVYYDFDGGENYGISDYFLNPNAMGFEFNIRLNFEKYGNYNVDLGPNYSIKLWGQDDKKLLLTAAAGPSFRMQDVPKYSQGKNGNLKEESETKYKFDLFANARLSFKAGHFMLSAGYFIWGAEFKLSKGYKADGFNFALGYSF
ncbi:MAG: hypothetical protein K5896_10675 [Prevotella sp.]|jgi:hypothetical protein|nr:hypothetical protein [Prevotella sp.]